MFVYLRTYVYVAMRPTCTGFSVLFIHEIDTAWPSSSGHACSRISIWFFSLVHSTLGTLCPGLPPHQPRQAKMFSVATATLRRTATQSPNAYSFVCRSMSSLPETMKVRHPVRWMQLILDVLVSFPLLDTCRLAIVERMNLNQTILNVPLSNFPSSTCCIHRRCCFAG